MLVKKKRVYSFKNKRRVDPYKIAQFIDAISNTKLKTAIEFAGLKDFKEQLMKFKELIYKAEEIKTKISKIFIGDNDYLGFVIKKLKDLK